MFPAGRNGSAIPVSSPRDLVMDAGKLWEQHAACCSRCRYGRGLPDPACDLGTKQHAVYEALANGEGR